MDSLHVLACRRFLVLLVALAVLVSSPLLGRSHAQGPGAQNVQQLAGWQVPGLAAVPVSNVTIGAGFTTGTIRINGISATLVVFKGAGQKTANVAVLFATDLKPSALLPAAAGTPLDDLTLKRAAFVVAPPENAGLKVATPSPLSSYVTTPQLTLGQGVSLTATADLSGNLQALLAQVNLPGTALPLSGGIDPSVFSGSAGSQLALAFINNLNLSIPLPNISPAWKPGFLTFVDKTPQLFIKGAGGSLAAGVSASVDLNLGAGAPLRFTNVTISRDAATAKLSLSSDPVTQVPAGLLALPVAGARLTSLAFTAGIAGNTTTFTLPGTFAAGGASSSFTVTLTGGAPATVSFTLDRMNLADLAGWSVPGLGNVSISNVTISPGLTYGAVTVNGISAWLAAFKGAGQQKANVAVLFATDLRLSSLVSAVKGTPLDDLTLKKTAFVIAPAENAGQTVATPPAMSSYVTTPQLTLPHGLSLIATVDLAGNLQSLLAEVNLPATGLPLSGGIDPSVFTGSAASQLARAFIDNLDLSVPLPGMSPAWKPGFVTFVDKTQRLFIKGVSGSLIAGITTSVDLNLGASAPLRFTNVTISRDPATRKLSFSSDPIAPPAGLLALPQAGASVTSLSLAADIVGGIPTFTLGGTLAVAGKPQNFTATLSGTATASYSITLSGGTLADLAGWTVPGLENVSVTNVTVGTGFTSGTVGVGSLSFDVAVFKGAGQQKANVAVLFAADLKLSSLVAALKGTPLDDLTLKKTAFVIAPTENAAPSVSVPAPVSSLIGKTSLALKAGVNLMASADLSGDVKTLFDGVGLAGSALPLSGGIDPSVFSGAGSAASSLAAAFLANLDLKIPLGTISIPGAPSSFTARNAQLAIKGATNGITAAITADTSLTIDGHAFAIAGTIALVRKDGTQSVSLAGASTQSWPKPFGIAWLGIRNVSLAVTLGQNASFGVSGVTDVGSVKDLTVTAWISTTGGQVSDVGFQLSGADIPLKDIPEVNRLPNISGIALRDVTVSTQAIGGTIKSANIKALDGLSAVLFQSGGQWSFAALKENFALADILPIPAVAQPILGKVKLNKAALVVSAAGINAKLSDLPAAAQRELVAIYGSPNRNMQLVSGLNLVTAIDPTALGPALGALGVGKDGLVLEGGIGGLFGGPVSLDLAVAIPPITPPKALAFLALPQNFQTSFYVRLQPAAAAVGIALSTDLSVKTKSQAIAFTTSIDFQLDTSGAFTIDVQGKTDSPWANALGVRGLTLDPGTRLQVSVSATTEVTLTFVGKSHIGAREVDLIASASVLASEGVIDKGAFEGKVSELDLEDLVTLTNGVIGAAGGKSLQPDFPKVRLTNVDVAFASPGVSIPEMNLPNGGIRLAGDLWYMLTNAPLGKFSAQVSENGLSIDGAISDFTIGPVALRGNTLDVKAQLLPPIPPSFKIRGGTTLFGKSVSAEVIASLTGFELATDLDLGELAKLDFHASAGAPETSASGIANADLALHARLAIDFSAWLRGARQPLTAVFSGFAADIKATQDALTAAQKKVDDLNAQIATARANARKAQQSDAQALAAAQKKVDDLAAALTQLDRDISAARGRITTCDYTVKTCVWRNLLTGKCTKHVDAPDLSRDAACAKDNISYGATVAAKEALRTTTQAAKTAADTMLSDLKKGVTSGDVTDLDPTVVTLTTERDAATLVLTQAQHMAAGLETVDKQMQAALDALSRPDAFVLVDSLIQGSLRGCLAGKPVALGLDFKVFGTSYTSGFAFSVTDPAFTADQLAGLALLIATKAVEADKSASPALAQLLQDAYAKKHAQVQATLDQVLKANGLE